MRLLALAALTPLLAMSACGEDIHRDRPVEIDGAVRPAYLEGEPTLGSNLAPGDELPILRALQGGRWVHVTVRLRGADGRGGLLSLAIRAGDAEGDLLGEAAYTGALTPTSDGAWLEAAEAPVRVDRTDEEVAALHGSPAHLTITYIDDSSSLEATLPLVFADE